MLFEPRRVRLNALVAIASVLALAGCVTTTAPSDAGNDPENGGGFSLQVPVDCSIGSDCWVFATYDHDRSDGRRDYACQRNPINDFHSTAFALANEARIADDVAVFAAADGVVLGARDAMADVSVNTVGAKAVRGRECGNAVRLQHADGWATQYCHMKRNSIRVATGDAVSAGTRLGAIGMSGNTELPYLGFRVEKAGEPVDPFIGLEGGRICEPGLDPLWKAADLERLAPKTPFVLDAGFSAALIKETQARTGTVAASTLRKSSGAIVLWTRVARAEAGDEIGLFVDGPNGPLVHQIHEVDRTFALTFRLAGRRKPKTDWPTGRYVGSVLLFRDGDMIEERTVEMTVTD